MILDYLFPRDVEEAVSILVSHRGRARILAGGTDSFSQLRQAEREVCVVDISNIQDLNRIEHRGKDIEIGAAVTLSHFLETSTLAEEVPALAEAVSRVGSPQIRNQGTVVGNILTGRAAANVRVATASLGAFLKVRGPHAERNIEIDKLDDKGSKLKSNEVAISLVIPRAPSVRASAYRCFAPRKAFSYAAASVSASVTLEGGKFSSVSVVASPILPSLARLDMEPCNSCAGSCRICRVAHLPELEQALVGDPATEEEIEQACARFDWDSIPMRDSLINGVADYRRHLLEVLSKRALASALFLSGKIQE